MLLSRLTTLVLAIGAGMLLLTADLADARVGGGSSVGSRGSRTFSAPPATNTAPKAAPIERSMTEKGAATAAKPAPAPGAAQPSRFGGWRGLLMGGLFAAGLASIFGIGALASFMGFLLQVALIGGLVYLAVSFFRSRSQVAMASGTARGQGAPRRAELLTTVNGASAGGGGSGLAIGQSDLDSFERLLGDIQTAYGREDVGKLGDMTTPEMLSYFSRELADRAKQGLRNEVSDVKLLQGDLSEAWSERGSDYATVAMRYALIDATVERDSGRVVAGDRLKPSEATELWTFRRDQRARSQGWQLSAIQQAA